MKSPWTGGIEFTTTAPREVVEQSIQAAWTELGYASRAPADHEAALTAGWRQLLLRPQPHRIRWQVESTPTETRLRVDVRYFGWYLALIVALAATFVPLLRLALGQTVGGVRFDGVSPLSLGLTLGLVGGILLGFRLLTAGSSDEPLQALRTRIESAGYLMEPTGIEMNPRYTLLTGIYLCYCCSLVLPLIAQTFAGPVTPLQQAMVALLTPLVLLVVVLLAIALMLTRRRGFSQRMIPLVPGLSGLLALLFWLAPLLIQTVVENFAYMPRLAELLARLDSTKVPVEQVKELMGMLRTLAHLQLGIYVLLGLLAVVFLYAAERQTRRAWAYLARLQIQSDSPGRNQAVAASGFLVSFQVFFAAAMVLFGWILGPPMLRTLHATGSVWIPWWPQLDSIVVQTGLQLRLILNTPASDPAPALWAALAWSVHGFVILVLWSLSVGTWLRRRSQLKRTLRQAESWPVCPSPSAASGFGPVPIVLLPSPLPFACAFEFWFPRHERFVAFSQRCADMLSPEERQAILAHEWAHFRAGDVLRDTCLQLLGRLCFVGDTFMRAAFLDSFGAEERADQTAVRVFGVAPAALWRALVRMKHAAAVFGLREAEPTSTTGLGLLPGKTLRRPASSFLHQYGNPGLGYWYPSFARRKAALEKLMAFDPTSEHHR